MSGFRNASDEWQEKCPCCGRFVACDGEEFYMWVPTAPDFISAFCNEPCARRYEIKGGKFITGDGEPYSPTWSIN